MSNQDYLKHERLNNIRHTLAHLTAACGGWPGSRKIIGPAIEDGFYQDFEVAGNNYQAGFAKNRKENSAAYSQMDAF